MSDNMSYGQEGQAIPEYAGPAHPTAEDLLLSLAEGQRANQDTITGLAQAVTALLTTQTQSQGPRQSTNGPKVKEPRTYDGDRSNGKLDDHIRDVTNWVSFYDARGY
jgi:hypothetical protein